MIVALQEQGLIDANRNITEAGETWTKALIHRLDVEAEVRAQKFAARETAL